MHLRSISMKGFKSFPDRTKLEFGTGVSVVVGPNGSGKSNITDAVLWALGEQSPLAVLVACSTGAMDAPHDCLAEELLKAEEGPVAVIAATRITMPYGNTVMGCEMLRACFRDQPEHLGDILRLAELRTLATPSDDHLRTSLDSLAAGLSPQPVDLAGERREHVLMYHLYGDPLLHLRYAGAGAAPPSGARAANR